MKMDIPLSASREHFAAVAYGWWSAVSVLRLARTAVAIALFELLGMQLHELRMVVSLIVATPPFGLASPQSALARIARNGDPSRRRQTSARLQTPATTMFI